MSERDCTMSEIPEVIEARKALATEQANHVEARDEIARLKGLARDLEAKIHAALASHNERLGAALVLQARSLSGWESGGDEWRYTNHDSVHRYRVGLRYESHAWLRKMVQSHGSTARKWTLDVDRLHVDGTTNGQHVFEGLDGGASIEDAIAAADAKLIEWGWLLADTGVGTGAT